MCVSVCVCACVCVCAGEETQELTTREMIRSLLRKGWCLFLVFSLFPPLSLPPPNSRK